MVPGLAIGAKQPDHKKRKIQMLTGAGHWFKAFEKQFGSADCRKLSAPTSRRRKVERFDGPCEARKMHQAR